MIKFPKSTAFPVDAIVTKSIISSLKSWSYATTIKIPLVSFDHAPDINLLSQLNHQNLVALPVVENVINSNFIKPPDGVITTRIKPRVLDEVPAVNIVVLVKSPKSIAFPAVDIVI